MRIQDKEILIWHKGGDKEIATYRRGVVALGSLNSLHSLKYTMELCGEVPISFIGLRD